MIRTEKFERGAGVLCHISSLPGKYGIGSFGKEAHAFADLLSDCGVKYWQILPLVQTTYGDSPYQSVCCGSGNPYFIDLPTLKSDGLLTAGELKGAEMPSSDIDYGELFERRFKTLRVAFSRFDKDNAEFMDFVSGGRFDDYALFMSLKSVYGTTFDNFPTEYKYRDKDALDAFRKSVYFDEYLFWQFVQFEFEKQWLSLKGYVNGLGIKIIGDIPLYVAYDSSDVWASPELFMLDGDLHPTCVAGVPPDYFSKDGQLWGNPLYNWDRMAEDGFSWWSRRIADAQKFNDIVRIDHFRGLDRYYRIPAGATTARVGEWVEAPGYEMLLAAEKYTGELHVIAEDLGVIDDGVLDLLKKTGFPRMKVLMFAFDGDPRNEYLPKFIDENSVSYTGTHDNDTAYGFIQSMDVKTFSVFVKELRNCLKERGISTRVKADTSDCVRALCLVTLCVKSDIAVLPIQDWLQLDNSCRMNIPSTASGNWRFRLKSLPLVKDRELMKKYIEIAGR